jgi:hypothetical protein
VTEDALLEIGDDTNEAKRDQILKSARVFSTGILAAKIAPDATHHFLIPFAAGALRAVNLPIARTEHDKKVAGQVVAVTGFISQEDLSDDDTARIIGLEIALTKDGFPGAEALGKIVTRNARKI